MELREIEALVRDTYRALLASTALPGWGRLGNIVSLDELRAALPGTIPRDQVDAALLNLAAHSDVHLIPRSDQRNAHPVDQEAAVFRGATHYHAVMIDPEPSPELVAGALRMQTRDRAESMVAALDDRTAVAVAGLMGVDPGEGAQALRQRLVAVSVANHDAWLAAAVQEQQDGTLLYQAEHDPHGLSADDLVAVQAAAERHAGNSASWPPMRRRAEQWLADPGPDAQASSPAHLARTSFAPPPATGPAVPASAQAGVDAAVASQQVAPTRRR
ncbi:hypothetical protein [Catellatospora sp. NPDC049609]|uniref:hypothetical protein n=1 Tax=Catellatospora sp. NPDC049609 TaxID=3155505 RepID=UPI00342F3150